MLKTLYRSGMVVAIVALSACSSDSLIDREIVPGDSRILLAGAITRGTETPGTSETLDGYTNLFLSAKTAPETEAPADYFTNVNLTVGEVYLEKANARYLNANAYYPLGEKEIKLFAHTGKLNNGKIALTAGTKKGNDYLISNGTDGNGTVANSTEKGHATELNFRHIMTKVEVKIELSETDPPVTEPTNIEIGFKNGAGGVNVAQKGTYSLTTAPGAEDKATPTGNAYTLQRGINYLIPTGETLSGKKGIIEHLKIDDYVAKDELKEMEIPQANLNGALTDFVLKPGYSYTLTFEIERLQIRAIKVTKKDWKIESGNGTWGYNPYQVKMEVEGGYENTEDKKITKIVLHHKPGEFSDTYQYIGSCEKEGENAKFLTLPTDMTKGTLTADLYTKDGLLIDGHEIAYDATAAAGNPQFTLKLGKNGMTKDKGNTYYEVKTPLQFYYLMQTPEKNTKYKLMKNIDFNSLALETLPQTDFPKDAELDGNGHSLLHLNLKGSGLFKQNNGTLKHLHIAFSNIDASGSGDNTPVGGFCSVNAGKIEACINEADIKAKSTQTIGGICGKNTGTILACLNTGNIPTGQVIGGICGENASGAAGAITACINAGMLNKSSNHEMKDNLGGICGLQSTAKVGEGAVINSCYWLTGSARPQQGVSQEKAIGSIVKDAQVKLYCTNTTNMTESKLREEAVGKLNAALGANSAWKFEYEPNVDTGTYKTVWPIPVANTPSNP